MQYNRHHIIQKSAWWSNDLDNLVKLKILIHQALHWFFGKKYNTPAYQLSFLFDIIKDSFIEEVRNEILSILMLINKDWKYIYKKCCIKDEQKIIECSWKYDFLEPKNIWPKKENHFKKLFQWYDLPLEQFNFYFNIVKWPLIKEVQQEVSNILEMYKKNKFDIYSEENIKIYQNFENNAYYYNL